MGNWLKNRLLQSGSVSVVVPAGGSASRPDQPVFGQFRFNTDIGLLEFFNGSAFLPVSAASAVDYTVDAFTGTGSQTVFTMTVAQSVATQIIVFVGSIYQDPATAYTVTGGFDITFTSAPPDGEPISVIHSQT